VQATRHHLQQLRDYRVANNGFRTLGSCISSARAHSIRQALAGQLGPDLFVLRRARVALPLPIATSDNHIPAAAMTVPAGAESDEDDGDDHFDHFEDKADTYGTPPTRQSNMRFAKSKTPPGTPTHVEPSSARWCFSGPAANLHWAIAGFRVADVRKKPKARLAQKGGPMAAKQTASGRKESKERRDKARLQARAYKVPLASSTPGLAARPRLVHTQPRAVIAFPTQGKTINELICRGLLPAGNRHHSGGAGNHRFDHRRKRSAAGVDDGVNGLQHEHVQPYHPHYTRQLRKLHTRRIPATVPSLPIRPRSACPPSQAVRPTAHPNHHHSK
jgi:hypothetical protein